MIRPEELDAADGRGAPAGERSVAIEVLEVVERTFLQPFEQRAVVLVRGARTELIPAMPDTPLEIGDHAAEVMCDHLEIGMAVHDAGEHQPRERDGSLERP